MSNAKILKLTAENVKRINVVEITPAGNLVVIAGKNGQGKTSVLDSIMYALGGAGSIPARPVKRGEEKASVELDLGDIVVRRTFTSGGGTNLTVTNKEGAKITSPQAILDELVGKLSFDPLAFAQQSPKERSEVLRVLVGLDFSKNNTERQKLYDERTAVNRDLKALEATLMANPWQDGVPDEPQSTTAILEEQAAASGKNAANAAVRRKLEAANDLTERSEEAVKEADAAIVQTKEEIRRLQSKLEGQKTHAQSIRVQWEKAIESAKAISIEVEALQDVDIIQFRGRLAEVEQTNNKVRTNKEVFRIRGNVAEKKKASDALTRQIDAIDKSKRDAIAAAKFPVTGLSLHEETGEVQFGGIPFDQASTAEQLRVSVAIGLALNNKLRVLLVRRGSDLDEDSLKMVAEMAAAADAQVWLERVSQDGAVSVIIEDGYARVPEQANSTTQEQPELVK